MKPGLSASSCRQCAAKGSRYTLARQSEPADRVRREGARQVTFSLMGGEKKHKSQVLAESEESCCWEEIAWGIPHWEEIAWGPLGACVGIFISLHSLDFAFSPDLLVPLGLGQKTCISLKDWPPPLLKGWKRHLYQK